MQLAEDRLLFRDADDRAGLDVPQGGLASSLGEAQRIAAEIGRFPLLIRALDLRWAAAAAGSSTRRTSSPKK